MQDMLMISAGAILGANLRYLISVWAANHGNFPLGTLIANILGSFLIGFFIAWGEYQFNFPPKIRLLILTGFLGSLTTFSTFSFESYTLISTARSWFPFLFVIGHVLLGLFAVWGGITLVRWLT